MGKLLHISNDHEINSIHDEKDVFRADVLSGLDQQNKQLHSKYFYDEKGCELFNRITRHPDYYITHTELKILEENKKIFSDLLCKEAFNLIELGPGEGIKTSILVDQFLKDNLKFTYMPIDISENYLKKIIHQFHQAINKLKLIAIHSDYFKGLEWLSLSSERRNVVLFLGSSIGNFELKTAEIFLQHLWSALHPGDYVLIGFDLRKEIDTLLRAYNDSDGITRAFNLNLLQRINRELNANFNLDKFTHYETYNVYTGAMESFLMSRERQTVNMLKNTFHFESYEPIHVEFSHKYLLSQIDSFATQAGFEVVNHFLDDREYFVDSLWRVFK